MNRFWLLIGYCLIGLNMAACVEPPEVVEIACEVVTVETAPPQEGVPVASLDLFLRATEVVVTRVVEETVEAVAETLTPPDYGYQAQGIAKLPSLDDGDAVVQTVYQGGYLPHGSHRQLRRHR